MCSSGCRTIHLRMKTLLFCYITIFSRLRKTLLNQRLERKKAVVTIRSMKALQL